MKRVANTLGEAREFIRQEKPFRLRGPGQPTLYAMSEVPGYFGRIPARHSVGAEAADYWVFSYDTLIAWVTEGEPTVPDVGYSPTTSQHQYLAAEALGIDFRPARGRDTVEVPRNDSLYGRPRRLRRGGLDGRRPDQPEPLSAYEGTGEDASHMGGTDYWDPDRLIAEVRGYVRPHP